VLESDTTARIDLESTAFDAFLVLKDSSGNVVASDDDGGNGLNSRIERVLAAGTYEIVASSFGPNQTGAYQLTVDEPPAAIGSRNRGRHVEYNHSVYRVICRPMVPLTARSWGEK
jgi:hypothetical protein